MSLQSTYYIHSNIFVNLFEYIICFNLKFVLLQIELFLIISKLNLIITLIFYENVNTSSANE